MRPLLNDKFERLVTALLEIKLAPNSDDAAREQIRSALQTIADLHPIPNVMLPPNSVANDDLELEAILGEMDMADGKELVLD